NTPCSHSINRRLDRGIVLWNSQELFLLGEAKELGGTAEKLLLGADNRWFLRQRGDLLSNSWSI
ncbi:MAG: hypothetical protein RML48_05615, partial [Candidatus Bipolaricaulota bacterium]|nr:hypothetical protein [Candidatus Bipolaricaulota bacterium]